MKAPFAIRQTVESGRERFSICDVTGEAIAYCGDRDAAETLVVLLNRRDALPATKVLRADSTDRYVLGVGRAVAKGLCDGGKVQFVGLTEGKAGEHIPLSLPSPVLLAMGKPTPRRSFRLVLEHVTPNGGVA